jgi:16S rRNA (cytidine1402-2'-O)-methyltransferase
MTGGQKQALYRRLLELRDAGGGEGGD